MFWLSGLERWRKATADSLPPSFTAQDMTGDMYSAQGGLVSILDGMRALHCARARQLPSHRTACSSQQEYDRSGVLQPPMVLRSRPEGVTLRATSQKAPDYLGVAVAGTAIAMVLFGGTLQKPILVTSGKLLLGLAGVLWTDLLPVVLILGGASRFLEGVAGAGAFMLIAGPVCVLAAWRFSQGRGVLRRGWLFLGLMVACAAALSLFDVVDMSSAANTYALLLLLLFMAIACWQFPPVRSAVARAPMFVVLAAIFIFASGFLALHFGGFDASGRLRMVWSMNVNTYGIELAQVGVFVLGYLTFLVSKAMRTLAWLSVAFCAYLIFLTGSRSSLVGFVVGSLVILSSWAMQRHRWRQALSSLIGGLVGVFVCGRAFATRFPALVSRWSMSSIIGGQAAGRVIIWRYALEDFILHPLLGSGMGTNSSAIVWSTMGAPLDTQVITSAHNIALQTLTAVGLVGAIPLLILCFATLRAGAIGVNRRPTADVVPYLAVVVCTLVIGVGEGIYLDRILWAAGAWTVVMATGSSNALIARVVPGDGAEVQ